jgi:hypothetical protein
MCGTGRWWNDSYWFVSYASQIYKTDLTLGEAKIFSLANGQLEPAPIL